MASPRVVGYFFVGLLALILGLVGFRLLELTRLGSEKVWVEFADDGSSISTLQPDDLVRINGVVVGVVDQIDLTQTGARVLVRFWMRQDLRQDAFAVNTSESLMGMRFLALDPGDSTSPPLEGRSIRGVFTPAIAETMKGILEVERSLEVLVNRTRDWVHGDTAEPAAHRDFGSLLERLEALALQAQDLQRVVTGLEPEFRRAAAHARLLRHGLRRLDGDLSSALPEATDDLRAAIALSAQGREILTPVGRLTTTLADPTTPLGGMVSDTTLLAQTEVLLVRLEAFEALLSGEVPLRLRPNIWGSNPSKRGL